MGEGSLWTELMEDAGNVREMMPRAGRSCQLTSTSLLKLSTTMALITEETPASVVAWMMISPRHVSGELLAASRTG